ncbi:MAG: cation transporting ATPase C-terminal domain-containing protein, partial [Clostridia bacterium]|nr:cation transporting ATPase C-terminal domain-containing protein [Clostridia bacterium]
EDTFDVSIFKNKELIFASVFAVLVSLLFIYVPALSRLIGVERIGAMTLIFALLTGLIPSIVAVGIKLFKKYVFSQNSKNVKNFI